MNKIYHLGTCSTCKRILNDVKPGDDVVLIDIKKHPIKPDQLEEMRKLTNTYESLFSKRAINFRKRGLHEQELTEMDFKSLLLEDYTFLKRPVAIVNGELFIGNSKKTTAALAQALKN